MPRVDALGLWEPGLRIVASQTRVSPGTLMRFCA